MTEYPTPPLRKDLPYNVARAVQTGFTPEFSAVMRLEVLQSRLDTVCEEIHDLLQTLLETDHPNEKFLINEMLAKEEKNKTKISWEMDSIRRWQQNKQAPKDQITPEMIERAMQADPCELIGSPLRTFGDELQYLSPLRKEKRPSFHFNRVKGVWIDRGTGEGGSIIDLAMRINGWSFQEAVKALAKH